MSRFDDDDATPDFDDGDEVESTLEQQVWQWLLLINPGDEELALQQFAAYREAVADAEAEQDEVILSLSRVIDWQSGFQVEAEDTRTLVQAIDELTARWNLSVDWEGEPDDDEFHESTDAPALLAIAYDSLAPYGYTLWLWEAESGTYAGGISLSRDVEPMRELATRLGIELRLGSEAS
ncbi:DUF6630 family protein [Frateuria aurantia]